MSDEPINCTQVRCSNCDNVVFIMTDKNSTQQFIDWVHKEKTNIACVKCLTDHVSKSELRAWCEDEKSSLIHEAWHDGEKAGYTWAINEILEKFCKGEK